MLDNFKIGLVVVLLLPGFIFIQVQEHHLLREKKPQFEKTLEIVLISCLIWIVALGCPILVAMGLGQRMDSGRVCSVRE